MTAFPMVRREVQVAARQPRTYRARLVGAGIFVGQLAWMTGAGRWAGWFGPRDMFLGMAWTIFWLGLLAGIARTSDCVSEERRENTLGLLFLTDLRGHDIIFGKLAARSLETLLMFVGLVPVLAIPILLGGVSPGELLSVVLALGNALFFALVSGVFASTFGRDSRQALVRAAVLVFVLSAGTLGLAELIREYWKSVMVARLVESLSLVSVLINAFEPRLPGIRAQYWQGLATTHVLSWLLLAGACLRVRSAWRDQPAGTMAVGGPGGARSWRRVPLWWRRWNGNTNRGTGSRLLEWNPVCWRSARERVSGIGFLLLAVSGIVGTSVVAEMLRAVNPNVPPLHIFTVCWAFFAAGLAVLFLARVAWLASHRLAEDRADGALDFLMATPLSAGRIIMGHWLATLRQSVGPALITTAVCLLFVYAFATVTSDRPGLTPDGWEILRVVVRGILLRPTPSGWPDGGVLNIATAMLPIVLGHAFALSWVGIWQGVSVRHPRNAPWLALGLVLAPPWLLFATMLELAREIPFLVRDSNSPTVVWGLLILCHLGWAAAVTLWSVLRLRRWFRVLVTSRYDWEAVSWWWWFNPHVFRRAAWVVAAGGLLLAGAYRWERWRGDRLWATVEREAAARGESLQYESFLPEPVPPALNLAQSDFFKPLVSSPGRGGSPELQRLLSVNLGGSPGSATIWWQGQTQLLGDWTSGQMADLEGWQRLYRQSNQFPKTPAPGDPARDVLVALSRFDAELASLRSAAVRPYARFPRVGWGSMPPHIDVFRQLSRMLNLRALCLLRVGDSAAALADVLLIVTLAEALGDEPSWMAQYWRGHCLHQAIQAVWEGLALGCWQPGELLVLQHRLEPFNFFQSYSRILRAETLREIDSWNSHLQGAASGIVPAGAGTGATLFRLIYPTGWIQRRKVELYRRMAEIDGLVDGPGRRIRPGASGRASADLPSVGLLAQQQASLDAAIVACALERFRMDRGDYPGALADLVPAYLDAVPVQVLDGVPLSYRRLPSGRFVLHSGGPDGRGSGGAWGTADVVWRYSGR